MKQSRAESYKRWAAKHPEYFPAYRKRTADHRREYLRQWRARNPEKYRAQQLRSQPLKGTKVIQDEFTGLRDATWRWKKRHPHIVALHRRKTQFKSFGMTPQDYDRMLIEQNNGCAICGIKTNGKRSRLDIDHDHGTGKVRGLLCHDCNAGLGRFKEDLRNFISAISYLTRHVKEVAA